MTLNNCSLVFIRHCNKTNKCLNFGQANSDSFITGKDALYDCYFTCFSTKLTSSSVRSWNHFVSKLSFSSVEIEKKGNNFQIKKLNYHFKRFSPLCFIYKDVNYIYFSMCDFDTFLSLYIPRRERDLRMKCCCFFTKKHTTGA